VIFSPGELLFLLWRWFLSSSFSHTTPSNVSEMIEVKKVPPNVNGMVFIYGVQSLMGFVGLSSGCQPETQPKRSNTFKNDEGV